MLLPGRITTDMAQETKALLYNGRIRKKLDDFKHGVSTLYLCYFHAGDYGSLSIQCVCTRH